MGCSHLLAVVTNAAMSKGGQVSALVPAFSSFVFRLRVELLGLTVTVSFLGCASLLSTAAASFYIPATSAQGPLSPERILPLIIPLSHS